MTPEPLRGPDFGSYAPDEVGWLLTNLSGVALEAPTEEREEAVQSGGAHYAESLPHEYQPDDAYLDLYRAALAESVPRLADAVAAVTELVLAERGPEVVLASLARAGTPIGILLRRWAARAHGLDLPHYAVSIVRGRGIDPLALRHLAEHHDPSTVVFVDGWTGKGAIAKELRSAAQLPALKIAPYLVVVADPAGQADLAATGEDYLIPSGILNGIVSGLVSRSVRTADLLPGQFDGCRILHELAPHDRSRAFVDQIDAQMARLPAAAPARWSNAERQAHAALAAQTIARLSAEYGVADLNRIKPGLAEATRAVLRRSPRHVLAADPADPALAHLAVLCAERQVPLRAAGNLGPYRAMALLD